MIGTTGGSLRELDADPLVTDARHTDAIGCAWGVLREERDAGSLEAELGRTLAISPAGGAVGQETGTFEAESGCALAIGTAGRSIRELGAESL